MVWLFSSYPSKVKFHWVVASSVTRSLPLRVMVVGDAVIASPFTARVPPVGLSIIIVSVTGLRNLK